jgi:Resolvase, N terminal domain
MTSGIPSMSDSSCTRNRSSPYSEKAFGARSDRTELRKVADRLQPGDVLVVTRLDRAVLNVLDASGRRRGAFEMKSPDEKPGL